MAKPTYTINQRSLMAELTASDPILKRVAEQTLREAFFEPAVEEMKREFLSHPVTQEVAGGMGAPNVSQTLEAPFRENEAEGDTPANLWGFIGFDSSTTTPDGAIEPVLRRLDPTDTDGPKMVYAGRDKDKLTYRFEIRAPDEAAIYNDTGMPWLPGISWVKRIEQGIPGIGHFLNVSGRPSSRSGGGIQVEGQLRSGRFRPTPYLSRIFNDFLRRVTGRTPNGRR